MCVKVEIWVNVEKFFKNIRWNETMCKIVHKIWARFSFFFLQINTILVAMLEMGMGPVSRGEDSYILLLEFSSYTVTGFTICTYSVGGRGKGTYKHSNVKKKKKEFFSIAHFSIFSFIYSLKCSKTISWVVIVVQTLYTQGGHARFLFPFSKHGTQKSCCT